MIFYDIFLIDFSSILIYFRSFLIDKWLSDPDSNFRFSWFSMKSRFWKYLQVCSSILIISDRILKIWKQSKNLKNDDDGWWMLIDDQWSWMINDHWWSWMINDDWALGVRDLLSEARVVFNRFHQSWCFLQAGLYPPDAPPSLPKLVFSYFFIARCRKAET